MFGPVLDDVARGYIAGIAVGTLVARRVERRRPLDDRDELIERWSLAGALIGLALGILGKLF